MRRGSGMVVVPMHGMVVHENAPAARRHALINPEIGRVAPVGPVHIKAVAAHRSR
jgi:hypothetical protein